MHLIQGPAKLHSMKRIPEPELMDEASQALAYAEADFDEPNQLFLELFMDRFPDFDGTTVVDLGCGPADITTAFALQHPGVKAIGVDGAQSMLEFGHRRIEKTDLTGQVVLKCLYLEPDSFKHICPSGKADAVISNSLLHHLATPDTLWQAINFLGGNGTKILVMDLTRPDSTLEARKIVDTYASDEPDILRQDFYNSLLAAYTVDEIRGQLDDHGLGGLCISRPSDRHLLVYGELTS